MKVLAKNKQAKRNYEILEEYQAGISLLGSEIKSNRLRNIAMDNSYVSIYKNTAILKGVNITEAKNTTTNIDPLRDRQLLLHKSEIRKIKKLKEEKGYSIIALCMGINKKGYAKVDIAVAKGLKKQDKRELNKNRDFNKIKKEFLG
jgi:SsrA-binding protein